MNEQENTLDQQWAHQEEQHRQQMEELEHMLDEMGVPHTKMKDRKDGHDKVQPKR